MQANNASELLATHYFLRVFTLIISKFDVNIVYLGS
jgi:hypothetical protein